MAEMAMETKLKPVKKYVSTAPDCVPGERWVTMSNALIRSAHGLTLGEKRLIVWSIAQLDSRRPVSINDLPTTRILASEYAEEFHVDLRTAYDQLKDAAKHLYNRSITFFEPAHNRKGKPISPTKVQMRWVGEVHYQEGEGWIELSWWPKLLPHLVGLKKHFTSYQLQQASALRSTYSWKLLELLTRFESTGWAEYDIEDFCVSMEATEKQRQDFAAIRRKIIEPAVKELCDKDNWIIQWEPIKAGRRVKAVRFTFMRDPQSRLPL